ncbi:MAG: hypothetical protein IJ420_07000 [Lachnospiraceae bacterium]|nr:hypothetical protein [Lachnospiraceae bacterium]
MKKRIILAVLSLMLCMLAGCLEATPLNEEEMDVVAEYAASLLLKYDKHYDTPLYYAEDREARLTPTPTPTPKPKNPTATPTPVADNKNPSGNGSKEEVVATPTPTPTPAPLYNQAETISQLTGLMAVEDITVSCTGCELMDSVVSNDYFSLQAKEGSQYAVVSFLLKNNSDRDIVFDASGRGLEYSIDVNTSTTFRASLSLLENDLQYMEIPVPASGTAEAVLVFEITDTEINTLHLIIQDKDDNTVFVKLQ